VTRRAVILVLTLLVALPASAVAYWQTTGSGTGSAGTAALDAGNKPSTTVSHQAVTVTWAETQFKGAALSAYANGSYTVRRYKTDGTFTAVCTDVHAATCTDTSVPYGTYTYRVVPKLGGFTGAESPSSDATNVVTDAPQLAAITQTNPATAVTNGDLVLNWPTVTGATSYTVYRGNTSGSETSLATVTTNTYTDTAVTKNNTYFYLVKATVVGLDSAASNEQSATNVFRPTAPTSVTATAIAGGEITVNWPSVAEATAGYNVYRRLDTATPFPATPLNGSTPLTVSTYTDTSAVDGTAYRYMVRAVRPGTGTTTLESADSSISNKVTADNTPPTKPTSVATTATPVVATAQCNYTVGTRFANAAGDSSFPVTATLPSPVETGEQVKFTATATAGGNSITQTVNATSTTVTATMDITSLADTTVTLTAVAIDAAGNASAATTNTTAIIHDTASTLTGVAYRDNQIFQDQITGTAECNASILVTNATTPTTTYPGTAGTNGAFTVNVAALNLGRTYNYNVQATDLAGNVSPVTVLSGTASGI
jgi:hypothetical protein